MRPALQSKFKIRRLSIMADWFKSILVLTIFFAAVYGWVMNIVKLADMEWATQSGMMIVRTVSIFVAPLGAILGYF